MQIKNNYDKEVFNGDIGRIKRLDIENQEVLISSDERNIPFDYTDLDEIVLAYAVSIHKSQGLLSIRRRSWTPFDTTLCPASEESDLYGSNPGRKSVVHSRDETRLGDSR
ncbi:MAG: hypothetical protein U5R49_27665 [Deltaproteobacteria bacterium]|nr:hypothetical protein [Deltaproteobacteria bacterium]